MSHIVRLSAHKAFMCLLCQSIWFLWSQFFPPSVLTLSQFLSSVRLSRRVAKFWSVSISPDVKLNAVVKWVSSCQHVNLTIGKTVCLSAREANFDLRSSWCEDNFWLMSVNHDVKPTFECWLVFVCPVVKPYFELFPSASVSVCPAAVHHSCWRRTIPN